VTPMNKVDKRVLAARAGKLFPPEQRARHT
jgi:hypothetical protein